MKQEQGFSLIELLIVVAIIAIIAAIAVPSMLTARMAANEAGAIQGCRTIGSAEVAFASVNNQAYAAITDLVTGNYLDTRFNTGFNGYTYTEDTVTNGIGADTIASGNGFQWVADSSNGGRYKYGIAPDQVVRYLGLSVAGTNQAAVEPVGMTAGDPIGQMASGS
jgi:prepilin-type N-terminal cleavage/methylation domain-containing protein